VLNRVVSQLTCLTVPNSLKGQAVVLDLVIPTTNQQGYKHRFVGLYAPWNPTLIGEGEGSFWPEITNICLSAPFSSSIIGDFNATLLSTETTSPNLSPSSSTARQAYSTFLSHTNALDLWLIQPQTNPVHCYTYKTNQSLSPSSTPHSSIIDRMAVSRHGIISGSTGVLTDFIPCTDHRPISTQLVLSPPSTMTGSSDLPDEILPPQYAPCFRFPSQSKKNCFPIFSTKVDHLLHPFKDILDADITLDDEYQQVYSILTDALLNAAVTTSTDSGFTAVTGASQYLIMPKHMSKELAEPMNINWKTSSIHRFENG